VLAQTAPCNISIIDNRHNDDAQNHRAVLDFPRRRR
jgi:hypothetical protein